MNDECLCWDSHGTESSCYSVISNETTILSKTTACRSDSGGQQEVKHTNYHLPDELWQQILSKLTLKDKTLASAVSKSFLGIANSVKTDKPPWLMFCPESGDSYKFYDPCKCESYMLDLPELRDTRLVYSKEGWLLAHNTATWSLFLFCPYTREVIKMPNLIFPRSVILSAAPTSPSCVAFSIQYVSPQVNQICTWRPGQNEWNRFDITFLYDPCDNLFFCNGLFYCFSFTGEIGIYNPNESSWSVKCIPPPKFSKIFSKIDRWQNEFIAEHDGDIIITYTCTKSYPVSKREKNRYPVIYKLDQPNKTWVKMETLGGRAIFLSYGSSRVSSHLPSNMRNNVYLPQVELYERSYISYAVDKGIYSRGNQAPAWYGRFHTESIWIDAPEDLSAVV